MSHFRIRRLLLPLVLHPRPEVVREKFESSLLHVLALVSKCSRLSVKQLITLRINFLQRQQVFLHGLRPLEIRLRYLIDHVGQPLHPSRASLWTRSQGGLGQHGPRRIYGIPHGTHCRRINKVQKADSP